ncbi:MAG: hypothetical protein IJ958_00875, partial [Agathobacter sp.]|nr:hypothetical protein [Agathobacter sp.]
TVYTNCDEVTLVVNGTEVATKAAVDHAVVFEAVVLNDGANTITAKAGDVEDTITLNGVAEHNYAYDLPEGNEGANWFDDPAAVAARKAKKLNYPKGYYSIKDKVGVLAANPQTAAILQEMMAAVMSGDAAGVVDMASMGDEMKEFMNMMTLSNMLKMMGGDKVSADAKYELNEKLNKIAKED